ncbi:hypothetical protein [Ascidiaceihabitans sp.]|uniref:hypothetical protein n=1 Tax=Ascidiaceihabitans sp. TaxID=1872644 RepID=UPI0032997AD4
MEFDRLVIEFQLVFEKFILAFLTLLPPFLFATIVVFSVVLFGHVSRRSLRLVKYQISFFSIIGVLIAYLASLTANTIVESLLPSLIVLLTFFFQLFGRSRSGGKVPLGSRLAFISGSSTVVTFLVSSRYFSLLAGT